MQTAERNILDLCQQWHAARAAWAAAAVGHAHEWDKQRVQSLEDVQIELSALVYAPSAQTLALAALRTHVGAIMNAEPRTMAGVVIMAQTLLLWGGVESFAVSFNPEASKWANRFAAALISQATAQG